MRADVRARACVCVLRKLGWSNFPNSRASSKGKDNYGTPLLGSL